MGPPNLLFSLLSISSMPETLHISLTFRDHILSPVDNSEFCHVLVLTYDIRLEKSMIRCADELIFNPLMISNNRTPKL
jgi:hypothetical protein